jgi:hypothetical protein
MFDWTLGVAGELGALAMILTAKVGMRLCRLGDHHILVRRPVSSARLSSVQQCGDFSHTVGSLAACTACAPRLCNILTIVLL